MQGPRYDDTRRDHRASVPARRRGGGLSPQEQAVRSAQGFAGNAAVASVLDDEEDERLAQAARRRQQEQRSGRLPIHLDHPGFDLTIAQGAFDAVAARSRVRSSRGFADALAGRRGGTRIDVRAATGATLMEQPARYRIGRRVATVTGGLRGFVGVRMGRLPRDRASGGGGAAAGIDLRRVDAAEGVITGRARIRLGQVDLTNAHVPVQVALDGRGSIRLAYSFRGGSLVLVGRQPAADHGAGLDWRYTLEVRTRSLGEAVWLGLPRRRRLGGAPPPGGGAVTHPPEPRADDDGSPVDDPPTERDRALERRPRSDERGGTS